jgi:uncharacterized integral membrane protein
MSQQDACDDAQPTGAAREEAPAQRRADPPLQDEDVRQDADFRPRRFADDADVDREIKWLEAKNKCEIRAKEADADAFVTRTNATSQATINELNAAMRWTLVIVGGCLIAAILAVIGLWYQTLVPIHQRWTALMPLIGTAVAASCIKVGKATVRRLFRGRGAERPEDPPPLTSGESRP